jgi:hypothetical protein
MEDNRFKADPSLKSFLFTMKNPHNFPARKFALKAEEKDRTIFCGSLRGPDFCDICVSGTCNANTRAWSYLGRDDANDTGLDGTTVLTGSWYFTVSARGTVLIGLPRLTVKEIEVFEIAD